MAFFKKMFSLVTILMIAQFPLITAEPIDNEMSMWVKSQVQNALQAYFGVHDQADIQIKPLTGGLQATSLLLDVAGKSYVLRIIKESENSLKVQAELYAMQQAATAGVAPTIHWVGADGHAILMDYIAGGTLNIERGKRPEVIVKAAEAMRKVHALQKNPFRAVSLEEYVEKIYQKYAGETNNLISLESAIAIIREGASKIKSLGGNLANAHGDLSPRNIVVSDQALYFIDWSEGLYTEPFHDLAYYSILMDYNGNEDSFLLQSYLQRDPTANEKARFLIAKKMNFARLAMLAQCVGNTLSSEQEDRILLPLPLKEWSYYASTLADSNDNLSAQFYLEFAQVAFKSATEIEI